MERPCLTGPLFFAQHLDQWEAGRALLGFSMCMLGASTPRLSAQASSSDVLVEINMIRPRKLAPK